jgi:hypothetical protein
VGWDSVRVGPWPDNTRPPALARGPLTRKWTVPTATAAWLDVPWHQQHPDGEQLADGPISIAWYPGALMEGLLSCRARRQPRCASKPSMALGCDQDARSSQVVNEALHRLLHLVVCLHNGSLAAAGQGTACQPWNVQQTLRVAHE